MRVGQLCPLNMSRARVSKQPVRLLESSLVRLSLKQLVAPPTARPWGHTPAPPPAHTPFPMPLPPQPYSQVSAFAKKEIPILLAKQLEQEDDASKALINTFLATQEAILASNVDCEFSGSTSVVCFLHGRCGRAAAAAGGMGAGWSRIGVVRREGRRRRAGRRAGAGGSAGCCERGQLHRGGIARAE